MQHAARGDRSSATSEGLAPLNLAQRQVLRLRLLSARLTLLQRTEKIASHHASIGEEAAIVGAALGARDQDWIFPGVREWGVGLVRGVPIGEYMHHAFGTRAARSKGHSPPDYVAVRKARIAPASGILGAHLPHAVGAAWAAKIKKDDVATVALFGAEVTSTGDFHNAMNFAGVFKAPCVFVCRGDIDVQAKGVAYGIATAKVDGMDVTAVQKVVRAAVERAASGKGATLIAAPTRPVTVLDDAALAGDGVLEGLPKDDAFTRDVLLEIAAAVDAAEEAGPPDPATLFADVYAKEILP